MIIKFANAKLKLGKEYSENVFAQPWQFNDVAFFDAMRMEAWSQEDWKALSDFYARSWFRRQGVVQDIILPNKVVVFCGDYGMDWLHFISFTKLYIRTSSWHEGLFNLESEFHEAGAILTIQLTEDFVGLEDS
jgi:hypothetical protein